MLSIFLLFFVLLAGILIAARIAREQGGSELGWAATTLVCGLLGFVTGAFLLGIALARFESLALLAAYAGPVLAVVFQIGALAALHAFARGERRLRGRSWPAFRLGDERHEGRNGMLRLEDELVFEPREGGDDQRVAYSSLSRCEVDGECLHLAWDGGEAFFQPGATDLVAAARTRLCEAIARELGRRRRRDPGPAGRTG